MEKAFENIIEKLKEEKMSYFLTIANTGDEKLDCAYEQVGDALDKAIEIVKQGGVADDVCEWKYPIDIFDNVEFEVWCNQKPLKRGIVPNNFSFTDFLYCHYCGKKIKEIKFVE